MAIIPIFHVVAAEKLVLAGQSILEGQVVTLDATTGDVVLQGYLSQNVPYGIAGDTKNTGLSSMPGVYSGWQNRASDYFDETKASGKMTVYHSGGEFATDQFAANVVSLGAYMSPLYGYNGLLDTHDGASTSVIVGYLTKLAGSYPSGVPGVDLNGNQALQSGSATSTGVAGDANEYIEFKMMI